MDELDGQRGGPLLAGQLVGGLPGAGTLPAEGSAGPEPSERWLAEALGDPDRLLVVGHLDSVTVGFGAAHVERLRRRPLVAIDMLQVEPPAREVGVGEAMLEEILAWATALGVDGVDAPALPGSRPSKAFFESHGFTARLLVMHRPAGGRP